MQSVSSPDETPRLSTLYSTITGISLTKRTCACAAGQQSPFLDRAVRDHDSEIPETQHKGIYCLHWLEARHKSEALQWCATPLMWVQSWWRSTLIWNEVIKIAVDFSSYLPQEKHHLARTECVPPIHSYGLSLLSEKQTSLNIWFSTTRWWYGRSMKKCDSWWMQFCWQSLEWSGYPGGAPFGAERSGFAILQWSTALLVQGVLSVCTGSAVNMDLVITSQFRYGFVKKIQKRAQIQFSACNSFKSPVVPSLLSQALANCSSGLNPEQKRRNWSGKWLR